MRKHPSYWGSKPMFPTDNSVKASVMSPLLQMGKLRLSQGGRAGVEQKTACLLWLHESHLSCCTHHLRSPTARCFVPLGDPSVPTTPISSFQPSQTVSKRHPSDVLLEIKKKKNPQLSKNNSRAGSGSSLQWLFPETPSTVFVCWGN